MSIWARINLWFHTDVLGHLNRYTSYGLRCECGQEWHR